MSDEIELHIARIKLSSAESEIEMLERHNAHLYKHNKSMFHLFALALTLNLFFQLTTPWFNGEVTSWFNSAETPTEIKDDIIIEPVINKTDLPPTPKPKQSALVKPLIAEIKPIKATNFIVENGEKLYKFKDDHGRLMFVSKDYPENYERSKVLNKRYLAVSRAKNFDLLAVNDELTSKMQDMIYKNILSRTDQKYNDVSIDNVVCRGSAGCRIDVSAIYDAENFNAQTLANDLVDFGSSGNGSFRRYFSVRHENGSTNIRLSEAALYN